MNEPPSLVDLHFHIGLHNIHEREVMYKAFLHYSLNLSSFHLGPGSQESQEQPMMTSPGPPSGPPTSK